MSTNGNIIDGLPVRPYVSPTVQTGRKASASVPTESFADVLSQVTSAPLSATPALKFSAHALQRIQQRGIQLQPKDVKQLEQAVDMMAQKGTKDGYVLYGNQGFVVNVPNRTVVTTMSHNGPTVVTNIDSVAIVPRLDQ